MKLKIYLFDLTRQLILNSNNFDKFIKKYSYNTDNAIKWKLKLLNQSFPIIILILI